MREKSLDSVLSKYQFTFLKFDLEHINVKPLSRGFRGMIFRSPRGNNSTMKLILFSKMMLFLKLCLNLPWMNTTPPSLSDVHTSSLFTSYFKIHLTDLSEAHLFSLKYYHVSNILQCNLIVNICFYSSKNKSQLLDRQ